MGSSGLYTTSFTLSFTVFMWSPWRWGWGYSGKPNQHLISSTNQITAVLFIIVNSGECYRGKEYGSVGAENKGVNDEQVAREGPHERIMLELRLE